MKCQAKPSIMITSLYTGIGGHSDQGHAWYDVCHVTGIWLLGNCVMATQFPRKNHRSNNATRPYFLGYIVVV